MTDFSVVVTNMLKGPAGPLKDAKFFAAEEGLRWMDQQERQKKEALFPTTDGGLESTPGAAPRGERASYSRFLARIPRLSPWRDRRRRRRRRQGGARWPGGSARGAGF